LLPILSSPRCVTPLGLTIEDTHAAIARGERVIRQGRIEILNEPGVDRVTQLARLVTAGLELSSFDEILLATSKGPADHWLTGTYSHPIGLHTTFPATRIFSSACASGLVALTYAHQLVVNKLARRVLVVAAESSFHQIFISCFSRLGVLASDGEPCKPFDESGAGFVLSEASACVIVESKEPSAGDIELHQTTMLSDALHLTSHRENGSTFRRAIRNVRGGLSIDRVHAHATGTRADAIELSAIRAELGEVEVESHKAFIGHTLGASGLLAAVLSMKACARGTVILAAGFGGAVAAASIRRA